MKIFINFTSIIIFSFSIIACNADSNKNSATKSNSKEISFLLGPNYQREYNSSDASSELHASSFISFFDQTEFQIQSWFSADLDKEGSSGLPPWTSSCKIEGEVTELANGLLLLTQIESNSDEKKDNVRVEMTLKLIDSKTFELSLIQPSRIEDVCRDGMGSNGGYAIVGEYTKETIIQNQDSSSEWYLHLRNLTWEQTKEKFLSEVGRWVRRWNQAGKVGGGGTVGAFQPEKWQGGVLV